MPVLLTHHSRLFMNSCKVSLYNPTVVSLGHSFLYTPFPHPFTHFATHPSSIVNTTCSVSSSWLLSVYYLTLPLSLRCGAFLRPPKRRPANKTKCGGYLLLLVNGDKKKSCARVWPTTINSQYHGARNHFRFSSEAMNQPYGLADRDQNIATSAHSLWWSNDAVGRGDGKHGSGGHRSTLVERNRSRT